MVSITIDKHTYGSEIMPICSTSSLFSSLFYILSDCFKISKKYGWPKLKVLDFFHVFLVKPKPQQQGWDQRSCRLGPTDVGGWPARGIRRVSWICWVGDVYIFYLDSPGKNYWCQCLDVFLLVIFYGWYHGKSLFFSTICFFCNHRTSKSRVFGVGLFGGCHFSAGMFFDLSHLRARTDF